MWTAPADVGTEPTDPLARAYAGLDPTGRNRRRIAIDLKATPGVQLALQLAASCDVLLEGFRAGVAERLGLGPDTCLAENPALVYGRMTGYGQDGPLAHQAGHDINYLALSGALDSIGHDGGPPTAPLGYLGDFGGGGLYLAFGVLAALTERQHSGAGQVVAAAIIDGVGLLGSVQSYLRLSGAMPGPRGTNELDGGHPLYGVYETADGQWISFGAVEPKFRAGLRRRLQIEDADLADQTAWPSLRQRVAKLILGRTRAQWEDLLAGPDICFAPVLSHEQAGGTPTTRPGTPSSTSAANHRPLRAPGSAAPRPARRRPPRFRAPTPAPCSPNSGSARARSPPLNAAGPSPRR